MPCGRSVTRLPRRRSTAKEAQIDPASAGLARDGSTAGPTAVRRDHQERGAGSSALMPTRTSAVSQSSPAVSGHSSSAPPSAGRQSHRRDDAPPSGTQTDRRRLAADARQRPGSRTRPQRRLDRPTHERLVYCVARNSTTSRIWRGWRRTTHRGHGRRCRRPRRDLGGRHRALALLQCDGHTRRRLGFEHAVQLLATLERDRDHPEPRSDARVRIEERLRRVPGRDIRNPMPVSGGPTLAVPFSTVWQRTHWAAGCCRTTCRPAVTEPPVASASGYSSAG